MKRVAMFLCLILALGWISNTGYLSVRYDNGVGLKGIPIVQGYTTEFTYNGVKTLVSAPMVWKKFHVAVLYVNDHFVYATPLGNGFLFQFKEIKGDSSRLPNR